MFGGPAWFWPTVGIALPGGFVELTGWLLEE